MDGFGSPWMWLAGIVLAVALERGVLSAVRAMLLAYQPISGEHTDAVVYHRDISALGERDMQLVAALLMASGLLLAAAWQMHTWPLWPALLLWAAALGWDLWTWERAAGSVKFVAWRRGWQHSARRVAVSDLSEVNVVVRRPASFRVPAKLMPPACYLALTTADGKAVKLPRTGPWLGGETSVENLANFVRMQMAVVDDLRKRAAAEKRSEARRAALPAEPVHPASRIDPYAINRGGPG